MAKVTASAMLSMPRTLAASLFALTCTAVFLMCMPYDTQAQAATNNQSAASASSTKSDSAPAWNKLSAAQQAALKPMQADWSSLDANRKKKWLAVALRFQSMSPADQERIHGRMQEWQKLSPIQRSLARDNYSAVLSSPNSSGDATGKSNLNEQWNKYQALSPEKKAELNRLGNQPAPIKPR